MSSAVNERVLRYSSIEPKSVRALLARHGLSLVEVGEREPIPGCYWGAPEAGVIGNTVYVRSDTPAHSLLHEACHLMVMPEARRAHIHTDASECQLEENATCYLQLLLSEDIAGFGFLRACADMDAWGYTFRLGSARAWFERDAEDALAFLIKLRVLPADMQRSLQAKQCQTSLW